MNVLPFPGHFAASGVLDPSSHGDREDNPAETLRVDLVEAALCHDLEIFSVVGKPDAGPLADRLGEAVVDGPRYPAKHDALTVVADRIRMRRCDGGHQCFPAAFGVLHDSS